MFWQPVRYDTAAKPSTVLTLHSSGVARLGIDPICFNDSPTGVANSYKSSQFPAEITYGATFNRMLTYEGGVAMGTEFKETGITNALAVVCGGLGTTYVLGQYKRYIANPS